MVKQQSTSRRKRGVLLSPTGWQRLQAAERKFERRENQGIPFTLEMLSRKTGLSPNTITKVRHQQAAVDRQTLEVYFSAFNLTLMREDCQDPEAKPLTAIPSQIEADFFYIDRPPLEALCQQAILQPGALLQIRAPQQTGKTSLLVRTLAQARSQGLTTVLLNLKLADVTVAQDVDRFLRWFCAAVSHQLHQPNRIPELWDPLLGSSFNCTDYFEQYLLPELSSPFILALDDLDDLCAAATTVTAFFKLLQTWHEIANYGDRRGQLWQMLRLVLVYANRAYLCEHFTQLSLDLGMTVDVPEFTQAQVEDLARRYGFEQTESLARRLIQFLNGHPNLTHLVLRSLTTQEVSLDDLIKTRLSSHSIFTSHLLRQLSFLQQHPELLESFKQVIQAKQPILLPPLDAIKLENLGLIRFEQKKASPQCQLYQDYFRYVLG